jgi:hypothetical protein
LASRRVAVDWYKRIVTVAHGHYRAALRYSRLNYWLGFPTVILTTVVGTSVFATLQEKPEFWWQITVGLMSIAAAILSALQSFLAYSDKAEKHRVAGAKYNALGRELELLLSQNDDWSTLDSIRQRVDALAQESPHIPESVHQEMSLTPDNFLWRE